MESAVVRHWFLIGAVAAALLCAGCSSKSKVTEAPVPTEETVTGSASTGPDAQIAAPASPGEDPDQIDPCDQFDTVGVLDGTQEWVYETTCRTAAWFDGFFGNRRFDGRSGQTYGRVGLSGFWDQRDGFDPKFRFRANFALPALRDRASLMIGRGSEEELIEERTTEMDTIPGNFNRIDDDSFLVGLGYTGKKDRGFKLSIGAKVRAPPEPYIKLAYRKHWALTESTMLGVRPIVYWKTDDKFGTTLHVDFDHLLTNTLMLRWANYGNAATSRNVEGLEWQSSLILFQALSNRQALTYRVMVLGETQAEVPLGNYGFEIRYRRRMLRDWLFLELASSVTWPQEFRDENRDANFGIGAGLEMYFGPVPEGRMH
jgi:hypothetical protein